MEQHDTGKQHDHCRFICITGPTMPPAAVTLPCMRSPVTVGETLHEKLAPGLNAFAAASVGPEQQPISGKLARQSQPPHVCTANATS